MSNIQYFNRVDYGKAKAKFIENLLCNNGKFHSKA